MRWTGLKGVMLLVAFGYAGRVSAQQLPGQTTFTAGQCDGSSKVGCVIPVIAGSFTVPAPLHTAHFANTIESNFTPLNSALATQLALLPFASPAAGFTYTLNPGVGVFTQTALSFGSIMTERAETIGRGKVVLGVSYQRFAFNEIDGIDLKNIPAVFAHADSPAGNFLFKEDFLSTQNSIDLKIHQVTVMGTVGVTSRFDVALAVPILDVRMGMTTNATIQRPNGTYDSEFGRPVVIHYFDPADPVNSVFRSASDFSTKSGLGDITVRLKGTILRGERSALALAGDIRLPTGDETNFLGSGAWGFRPFMAYSTTLGRYLGPHANVGFLWNGSSVLAGNITTGAKARLPRQFSYAAGTDVAAGRHVTLAFDLLGERIFSADRLYSSSFTSTFADSTTHTFPDVRLAKASFNMLDISAGAKIGLPGKLLLTLNAVRRLNDAGLRTRLVPMVGLARTF